MSDHHVLQPGEIAIGTRGDRMETLLGSCVAVVLSDPRGTVGAMCHIVHAGRPGLHGEFDTAYAGNALQALCTGLRRLGITPQLCQARVYGGGNMFPAVFSSTHVGLTNVERVLDWLAEAGIPVLSQSVGGTCYRKLGWVVGPDAPECLLVDVLPACP